MKLTRFQRPDESIGWGISTPFGIQDVCSADSSLPTSTTELIRRWSELKARVEGLSKKLGTRDIPLRTLCPIDAPGKILCIGLNYRDHAIETGAAIPDEPIVFSKMACAMIGPDENIVLPKLSQEVDYEAELVVVIGSTLKHATPEQAAQGIFGYSVGHDVSARDWQKGKPGKQWLLGKSFDTFAPLGPSIVTSDEITDTSDLPIRCTINGNVMQDSSTRELIFTPVQLVEYISKVMTLEPGDVIYTGTPNGVGMARTPQVFLKPGDEVEITISGVGTLRNRCVAED